jgi:hypothetical protein
VSARQCVTGCGEVVDPEVAVEYLGEYPAHPTCAEEEDEQ